MWQDNTDSMVDRLTLVHYVQNFHEQGLYKPSTSVPPNVQRRPRP
jgi:hypothetical protein